MNKHGWIPIKHDGARWPVDHSLFTTDLDNMEIERQKIRCQPGETGKYSIEEGTFGAC